MDLLVDFVNGAGVFSLPFVAICVLSLIPGVALIGNAAVLYATLAVQACGVVSALVNNVRVAQTSSEMAAINALLLWRVVTAGINMRPAAVVFVAVMLPASCAMLVRPPPKLLTSRPVMTVWAVVALMLPISVDSPLLACTEIVSFVLWDRAAKKMISSVVFNKQMLCMLFAAPSVALGAISWWLGVVGVVLAIVQSRRA